MNKYLIILSLTTMMSLVAFNGYAAGTCSADTVAGTEQTQTGPTVLPPLFDYPVVPDDIQDWQARSTWLIEHFWDNFNFKQKAVGQVQLNHAFKTYSVPMRFAPASTVMSAVEGMIKKLKNNPGLLLQFTMAAERNIYDPATAEVLVDEVYLPFLKALVNCKKLPEIRKAKYKMQLASLEGCMNGDKIKSFPYITVSGETGRVSHSSPFTLIEFGDPGCSECRILRLKIETDSQIRKAVDDGLLKLYFIIPDVDPEDNEWHESLKGYERIWNVGAATDLEQLLDLRTTPCIYILDSEGKIITKNGSKDDVIYQLENLKTR